jgi:tetratricopeptide (TPR) repeat protein
MQAVAAHNLPEAGQLSTRFDAELWRISQQHKDSSPMPGMKPPQPPPGPPKLAVMPDALLDPLLKTLSIMSLEVRGSLLSAQGKTEDAKALFASAAREQKELGYREPPNYIRPVGEAEGAAMLAARKWPDAKAAFERALADRPHSGFALYGIALASEQSGDREAAVKTYADFLTAWKEADSGLPQIAHARAYMSAHRAP